MKKLLPYIVGFVLGSVLGSIGLIYLVSLVIDVVHGPRWSGTTRMVEELHAGKLKQGDKVPAYAETCTFSWYGELDETWYGSATYEDQTKGIVLLIFWYRPPSESEWIMHSAFCASGGKLLGPEEWYFYDAEQMATHVKLAFKDQRDISATTEVEDIGGGEKVIRPKKEPETG